MKLKVFLATSVSVTTVLAASAALAQSSPNPVASGTPDQVEEIVVTGFRASLASAIEAKRTATAIVDSISAEDIGKFPEQNLAESLQRITGVQISRSKGEGQNVSIRGLNPDFNQISLNGRSLPSPSGSRSFDFTILSSDLINGLDVYKTPTADLIEGGLAGTVNVKTLRPKDVRDMRLVANVENLYEGNAKKSDPHFALLFADRLFNDRLSVIAGVDYSKRAIQTYRYEAFGLELASEAAKNLDYNRDGDRLDSFKINHAPSFATDFGQRERLSGNFAVGFQVTDNFDVWAEAINSRFTNDNGTARNAHRFTNISDPNGVQASTIDSNGIVTVLDSNGVDHRNNGRPTYYKDSLDDYAVGGSWSNGPWKVSAEASAGKARRVATDVSLEVIARASVSQNIAIDPGGPAQVTYTRGYDPLNKANWRALGLNGTYKQPTTDETKDARFDVAYDFEDSFFKSLKVGLQASERTHEVVSQTLFVSAQQLAPLLGETYSPTIEGGSFAAGAYMRPYNFSNFLGAYDGKVSIPSQFLSSDPKLVFAKVSLDKLAAQFPLTKNLAQTYGVQEDGFSGYAMVNFANSDDRLSGNAGLRVVKTSQTSSGYSPDLSLITFNQQGATTTVPSVTAVQYKRSYTNVLPSLNLRYEVQPDFYVRFAAARVLSRPTLSILAPNTIVSANVLTITKGNPDVDPYLSDQYDLSAEWYFKSGALLSGAIFYKDVQNFIVNTSTNQTLQIKQVQGATVPMTFNVLQPDNGGNSKIKGFEIGYQQPLSFLPSPFDGLGVIANYTYVSADPLSATAGQAPTPLPGVSKNNYNLVAYYEKGPFGARISYNYRDKFVVDTLSYFGDGQYTNKYDQLDFSSSYKLNDHIEFTFDVLNISNSPIVNVNKYGTNRGYEDNGRRITLGARLKL
ncbi:TonB-dependent receptor [Caulobacter sp. DWP3-1-3b2]|uniref:TonB-dependent receptor n=1 Tax=Caulobacter sp. DWP3-1-3b2 TaxID=2804643 RepID=UPI003CF46D3E